MTPCKESFAFIMFPNLSIQIFNFKLSVEDDTFEQEQQSIMVFFASV